MRYLRPPILEAVLEFRWEQELPLDDLRVALEQPAFSDFDHSKPRISISAAIDTQGGGFTHETREIGFEVARRDGAERIFLESNKFVYLQAAPYDRWETFSHRALSLLGSAIEVLQVHDFVRVGLRFVNRIDIPKKDGVGIDPDDYVTISFNGPRMDKGIIEEFQMRVVKPTEKEGLHYALVLATTAAPLPNHASILLDIDVFTRVPIVFGTEDFNRILEEMRNEKNQIFQDCLKDKARDLFGGVEE